MRYLNKVTSYDIDLNLSESLRWRHVIQSESAVARSLMREVAKDFEAVPWAFRKAIGVGYRQLGGLYTQEMRSWADALGIELSDLVMFQCSYELTQLGHSVSFCTSGMRYIPKKGMYHFRTLDWPIKRIGEATRLFRLRCDSHDAIIVGLVGHVGALSGMVPGRYSVSLNWAEQTGLPSFTSIGPTFLIRDVIESCDTYSKVVSYLRSEPLFGNAFFSVCGVKRNEACVIERTCREAAVRKIGEEGLLIQANHFVSKKFRELNTDQDLMEDSSDRFEALMEAISHLSASSTNAEISGCLSHPPVQNADSHQKMIFHPSSGSVKVWRSSR